MGNKPSQIITFTFEQFRNSRWTQGANVEIRCAGGAIVKAHGTVLAWASPEVLGEWYKSQTPVQDVYTLEARGDDLEAWQRALIFLYPVLPRPTMTLEAAHQLLSIANKYRMANLRDGIGRCVILNSSQLTNKTSNPPHLQLEVWASVGGHWGAAELLQACAAQAERLGMKVAEIAQLIDLVKRQALLEAFQGLVTRRIVADKDHTIPLLVQLLRSTHTLHCPGVLRDTTMHMLLSYGAVIDVMRSGEAAQQLLSGLPRDVQAQLLMRWVQVAAVESKCCKELDAAGHPLPQPSSQPPPHLQHLSLGGEGPHGGVAAATLPHADLAEQLAAGAGAKGSTSRVVSSGGASGCDAGMSALLFSLGVLGTAPEVQQPGASRDACLAQLCSPPCSSAALASAHLLPALLHPLQPEDQLPLLTAWFLAGVGKVSKLVLWGKRLFADYGGALPTDHGAVGGSPPVAASGADMCSHGGATAAAGSVPHALMHGQHGDTPPRGEEQAVLARFSTGTDVQLVCRGGQVVAAHSQALMWASERLAQLVGKVCLLRGDKGGPAVVEVMQDEPDAWCAALMSLYPVLHPPMDLARAQRVVALAHHHCMQDVLEEVTVCVTAAMPTLACDNTGVPSHHRLQWWAAVGLQLGLGHIADLCKARILKLTPLQLGLLLGDDVWKEVHPNHVAELNNLALSATKGLGQAGKGTAGEDVSALSALLAMAAAADKHGLEPLFLLAMSELRGRGAVQTATAAAAVGKLWEMMGAVQSGAVKGRIMEGWLVESALAMSHLQVQADSQDREHMEGVNKLRKQLEAERKQHQAEVKKLKQELAAAKAVAAVR